MKHLNIKKEGAITHNESYEGERIEQKIERIVDNNEPIQDGAPLIFTERKDGVKPEFDIRTDRFEIAIDAMDVVSKTTRAKRENVVKMDVIKGGKFDGVEPIQATDN